MHYRYMVFKLSCICRGHRYKLGGILFEWKSEDITKSSTAAQVFFGPMLDDLNTVVVAPGRDDEMNVVSVNGCFGQSCNDGCIIRGIVYYLM
jgi:hypothetical protein